MQNVVVNMCEKFHNDRLRNDRDLGNGKSDNNNTTPTRRTTFVALGDPSPGLIIILTLIIIIIIIVTRIIFWRFPTTVRVGKHQYVSSVATNYLIFK